MHRQLHESLNVHVLFQIELRNVASFEGIKGLFRTTSVPFIVMLYLEN